IFVEVLHVGVSRGAIEVEVILFDILTMIPFTVRQPKQPFFEDRVLSVPQGEGETEELSIVRDARQPVLTPAVRTRASLVMGKIVPGVARLTVIFPHSPPLPLAQVGTPLFPRDVASTSFL